MLAEELVLLLKGTTPARTTKILMARNGAPLEHPTAQSHSMFILERRIIGGTARTIASRRMWALAVITQIRASSVFLQMRGASLKL